MPLVFLALGLGSFFAWGLARAKREESARRQAALSPARDPFPWEASSAQAASPPSSSLPGAAITEGALGRKYDQGLSADEVAAIVYARAKESDPKKLDDFADTLDPDYPIAVLRLREQARQLRRAPWRQAAPVRVDLASTRLSERLSSRFAGMDEDERRYSTFHTLPMPNLPGRPVLEDPKENVDFVPGDQEGWERARAKKKAELDKKLAAWEDVMRPTLDVFENTRIPVSRFSWGIGGPAKCDPGDEGCAWEKDHPVFEMKLGEALRAIYYNKEAQKNRDLESKGFFAGLFSFLADVIKAIVKVTTLGSRYIAAPLLSYIPGIGTAAAAIVTTSTAIAMGERVDKAFVEGAVAAVPGQPFSGEAIKTGIAAIEAVAKGERFDAVLLAAVREAALGALPANVRAAGKVAVDAVDVGIALAQAKDLQDAGFSVLRKLARGNSDVERAADFADQMTKSAKRDLPVEVLLKENVRLGLTAIPQPADQLRALLSEMSKNPSLMKKSPAELAQEKSVPEPLAHAALATVRVLAIPKWQADALGLKEPVLYVDASLAQELVPPPYLGLSSLAVEARAQGNVYAKIQMRKSWVMRYLQQLNIERHPFLQAASPGASFLAPKGFR